MITKPLPPLKLLIREVENRHAQENFLEIQDYVQDETKRVQKNLEVLGSKPAAKLVLMTHTFLGPETNFAIPHNLGYKPEDVLLTYKKDGVTVTFSQDQFTDTNVIVTVSAATKIKFLIGRL